MVGLVHSILYEVFITGPNQVRSITDKNVLLQSGIVFYKRAKLTGTQYKHRVIFTLDDCISKWLVFRSPLYFKYSLDPNTRPVSPAL